MKSLKTIQTLAKVGKIISKVVFILCIVGACACFAGIVALTIMKVTGLDLEEMIVKFDSDVTFNFETTITSMIIGLVNCGVEIFLAKKAELYFTHELEVGQPFTKELSREMRNLGITIIIASISATVICAAGVAIARLALPSIEDIDIDGAGSLFTGLAFIVVSVLCDYGAEKNNDKIIDVTEDNK